MNFAQIEYWNGPAAERWTTHQEILNRALEPFGHAVLARADIAPGQKVVDVGCGCGSTTLALADLVGDSGHVIGIDVSSTMLRRAAARLAGRRQVTLLEADAATHRFPSPADGVVSRFGVMFFDRPVEAFRNIGRSIAHGGRLVFACWRAPSENAWVSVPMTVALRHLNAPAPTEQDEPGPFSLADRSRVENVLRAAGFVGIRVDAFEADVVMSVAGLEPAVDFAMTAGMVARLVADAPPAAAEAVREDLRRELARTMSGQRVALGGAVWIASAIVTDSART